MLIGKTRRVRKSFFSPTAPKRPPRLWDKSIIWTVLPLAASAMLFIFTLRSVELRLLGEAKPRVRYLTDAARIRDMSASLRFWASELVLDAGGLRGDITPRLLPDTMSSEQGERSRPRERSSGLISLPSFLQRSALSMVLSNVPLS